MAYPLVPNTFRARFKWTDGSGSFGSRLFYQYGGTTGPGGNMQAIAVAIAGAWGTHLASVCTGYCTLKEVDTVDLSEAAPDTGTWTGSEAGTRSGDPLTSSVALDVEAVTGELYRGGHPVLHLPPGVSTDLQTVRTWDTDLISDLRTGWEAYVAEVAAIDLITSGGLEQVVLRGYRNNAVPEAVHPWTINSYRYPTTVGTMRRRLRTRP